MKTKKPMAQANSAALHSPSDWRLLCAALLEERDRLKAEMKQIHGENDLLKRNLYALLREEIPIDKQKMLAQFGREPPLTDLIAELRQHGD